MKARQPPFKFMMIMIILDDEDNDDVWRVVYPLTTFHRFLFFIIKIITKPRFRQ